MKQILLEIFILLCGTIFQTISAVTYNCSANAPCGCSANSAVLTKIVGGEQAASQTWGWAASLRYTSSDSHFCGGSIISEWHILTAAHCAVAVASPSAVRVHVGSIYSANAVQARSVSEIYTHPSYSSSTYLNDIAILKLSSPLDLDQAGVDLVCLPNVSSTVLATQEYPAAGRNLIAIGWGVLSSGSQATSSILRQVTIQSVAANSVYCQSMKLQSSYTQFCAGVMPQGGKDTCQGDSGGPLLMFTSNNVWEQVGVTSNGYKCAQANYPGIYTRVAAYQAWINATMNHASQTVTISHPKLVLFVISVIMAPHIHTPLSFF